MLAEQRRQQMVELVGRNDTMSVTELAQLFETSESTIRRDLDRLEEAGLLVKVHGGAASVDSALKQTPYVAAEPTVAEKRTLHAAEKRAIAARAASLITPDDFVYLDAGTTTQLMVDQLTGDALAATFVTNSVSNALALAARGTHVIVIGGDLKAGTEAIVGPGAIDALSRYNFSKAFLGANGVTREQGFTTPDTSEAMVKLLAARSSAACYVLADAAKIGTVTPVSFCSFSAATLITCGDIDPEYKQLPNVVEVTA